MSCCLRPTNAADALMGVFGYTRVRKGIEDADAFDRLVAQMSAAIEDELSPVETAAFARMLAMSDVAWAKLSQQELAAALAGIGATLPSAAASAARLSAVIAGFIPAIIERSRAAVELRVGAQLGALTSDAVIEYLKTSESLFVTDYLKQRNEAVSAAIRGIVADALQAGATRKHIMSEIERQVGPAAILGRSVRYYDVVAGQFVAQARTYGMLTGMRDAGIQQYEWHSVCDEVTSQYCLMMHGTVFNVSDALSIYARVAENPQNARTLQPWVKQGKAIGGETLLYVVDGLGYKQPVAEVVRAGTGFDDLGEFRRLMSDSQFVAHGIILPPAHGNCRSVVLPVV